MFHTHSKIAALRKRLQLDDKIFGAEFVLVLKPILRFTDSSQILLLQHDTFSVVGEHRLTYLRPNIRLLLPCW